MTKAIEILRSRIRWSKKRIKSKNEKRLRTTVRQTGSDNCDKQGGGSEFSKLQTLQRWTDVRKSNKIKATRIHPKSALSGRLKLRGIRTKL